MHTLVSQFNKMPYYCTVPRCTSMAGKAKNVSFHQFPRDVELAKIWNHVLKRGKPHTKYSKVCSLHFKPEDYTATSAGQLRLLRKDAIPSQNLPSDIPVPYRRRRSGTWTSNSIPALDLQVQHQITQAMLQTMLAMQAAGVIESSNLTTMCKDSNQPTEDSSSEEASNEPFTTPHSSTNSDASNLEVRSFKCDECSRCFKDPDVLLLHKRTNHTKTEEEQKHQELVEKENFDVNIKTEMLKSNPILANLLKNGGEKTKFDTNILSKHIVMALVNMECLKNIALVSNLYEPEHNRDEPLESNLIIDDSG